MIFLSGVLVLVAHQIIIVISNHHNCFIHRSFRISISKKCTYRICHYAPHSARKIFTVEKVIIRKIFIKLSLGFLKCICCISCLISLVQFNCRKCRNTTINLNNLYCYFRTCQILKELFALICIFCIFPDTEATEVSFTCSKVGSCIFILCRCRKDTIR